MHLNDVVNVVFANRINQKVPNYIVFHSFFSSWLTIEGYKAYQVEVSFLR